MCGIMINNRKDSCKIQESEYLWQKRKAHSSVVDGTFRDMGNIPSLNLVICGGQFYKSSFLYYFLLYIHYIYPLVEIRYLIF